MEFLVLNGRPWILGKRKSSVEFNCRLICKQRVPGRVLPGSSYRVKNWSRASGTIEIGQLQRTAGWARATESAGSYIGDSRGGSATRGLLTDVGLSQGETH